MPPAETSQSLLDADSTQEHLALKERIEKLLKKCDPSAAKSSAKPQHLRGERVALANDIAGYLSRHFLKRTERLEIEWKALEAEKRKAEARASKLRGMSKKTLEDCIQLAGLEKFVAELDRQQDEFRTRLQKEDIQKRAEIESLAPFVGLMRIETVSLLQQKIEVALLPFCDKPHEAAALALKTPAYMAADLRFRWRDWASRGATILPEAAAEIFLALLNEYTDRFGKSEQGE